MAAFLWVRFIRVQDVLWLLLFSGLAVLAPNWDLSEIGLLLLLCAVQIAEPRLNFLAATSGRIFWVVCKLLLAYLLIGYTGGLTSRYYLLLLLPVVSAATWFGVLGTLLVTLLACSSYLSFALFIDWSRFVLGPPEIRELGRRAIFLAMAGNLVNVLAEMLRVQSVRFKNVAEQLAAANRSLQQAEAAMRRSERLAALGQLSAGLAHELRNPLGTMKASSEMLARSVAEENAVAREVAGFISSEVDRTNSLVTRFLEFARPLQLRLAPADLSRVIDRAADTLERDADSHGVTIYKNYSPDLAPLPLDPELMERAVCNLLLNAIQATAPGGAVTVKTRLAGGAVEVSVIDRGSGIDPQLMETIFNPFVTTKPEGVGLGLAIVSKIVDEHGGKISVESDPGRGSVFRVVLPLAKPGFPAA